MKELEEIINDIKGDGKFQKRLFYLILVPLFIFLALNTMMQYTILFQSPDHWCKHPMAKDLEGDALEEWKSCYIPKNEEKKDGSYDMCKIVLPKSPSRWNITQLPKKTNGDLECPVTEYENHGDSANVVVEACQSSWMYDKTEFSRTIVTDLDWVCSDAAIVPNLHSMSTVGGLVGGLVYSYLGDQFGRKYIFWLVVFIYICALLIKTFLVSQYYVFLVFHLVACSAPLSIYQLPVSLISEISNEKFRSLAILLSWMAW